MDRFVKIVAINIVLFLSCLINGLLLMWVMNPVFDLHIGYWSWFAVAFVATEIVNSGVSLHNGIK